MKEYIEERAIQIANYIIDENATVRQTAKRFGISKSTVHKDVTSDPYRSVPGGTGESGSGYQQGGAAYPRRACDEGEVRA